MKKLFFFVVAMVYAVGVYAQTSSKEIVIVDPFTMSMGIDPSICYRVRSETMSELSKLKNIEVVDALVDSRLSKLYANRKVEDVVTETNWKTESDAIYKSMAATKLLKGQIDLCDVRVFEGPDITGNGAMITYITNLSFVLSVYNIADGTVVSSKNFNSRAMSAVSRTSSFDKAYKKLEEDVRMFCLKCFKMRTYVLELGEPNKKGIVKDVWISGGANIGVTQDMALSVLLEKKIGPNTIYHPIGRVVAKEVHETTARCELSSSKESAAVKEAFGAGKKIYVEVVTK